MADAGTTLPPQDLNRIAEQVARILALQRLDDVSAGDARLFGGCSSTKSEGCSSVSRGCTIELAAPSRG